MIRRNTVPGDISLLESVFDASPDGISVLDPDLNILWVNTTMKKWYPRSEPGNGFKCYRIYHVRNHPCRNCPAIRALESCNLKKEIVPLPMSRQGTEWLELNAFPLLDVTGVPNGVVEYVRNITDRVTVEQGLRKSEQLYRLVADFVHAWVYWIAPDSSYIYVSPSCERMTGYPANAFLEDAGLLEKIVHPDDRALVKGQFEKHLTDRDVMSMDFRILTCNGEERWISHICQPVYGDDGQFMGRRASNRDITERKLAEENLQKAHKDLECRVTERNLELKNAAEELKHRQTELLSHKAELEKVNKELLETNKAISVLARNIDKSKQETENTISKTINFKIMPIVENLRKAKATDNLRSDIDIMAAHVQALTKDLTGDMNIMAFLTASELRVATMIKNGLTSQAIAEKLCISLHTAKTHRRNIRKKLNVQNSKVNLASYLRSIMW